MIIWSLRGELRMIDYFQRGREGRRLFEMIIVNEAGALDFYTENV